MVIKKEGLVFKIELEDLPKTSTLGNLETIDYSSFSLGLLTECEELFDADLGTRHPVILDVKHKFFPRIDEHSRLSQALQAESEWMYGEGPNEEGNVGEEEEPVKEEEVSDSVSKVYESVIFRYTGLDVRDGKVAVSLESDNGDCEELYVVQDVQGYQKDTQYAGAIYPDRVKSEVSMSLAPYDLEEGELDEILAEVQAALEKEGINFYEE